MDVPDYKTSSDLAQLSAKMDSSHPTINYEKPLKR